jgi:hypothetical protein
MNVDINVDRNRWQLDLPAKQAEGVGSDVGSDSAIFFSTCWSCGEESICTQREAGDGKQDIVMYDDDDDNRCG